METGMEKPMQEVFLSVVVNRLSKSIEDLRNLSGRQRNRLDGVLGMEPSSESGGKDKEETYRGKVESALHDLESQVSELTHQTERLEQIA
jgi:hypothetical protein